MTFQFFKQTTRLSAAPLLMFLASGIILLSSAARAEEGITIPAPAEDVMPGHEATETAVLAGGCFWGVQGVFQHVEGVKNAVSGYSGGEKKTAVYETVGSGRTGHAESVQVTFDPKKISYGKILQIYFSVAHDPTQLNRQGPDSGSSYRSEIFFASETQEKIARAYVAQLAAAHASMSRVSGIPGTTTGS